MEMQADIEREERELGSDNRAGTERGGEPKEEPVAAVARSLPPLLLLPRSGVSSVHRPSFFPTVFPQRRKT